MKVFYYCYGSAHSSVISAAIHTGMVGVDRIPTPEEIVNLPHYDKTENPEIGIPFFYGYDEMGNEVYIIGMGADRQTVMTSVLSMLKDCGVPGNNYLFINTLDHVKLKTRVGGYLSRALGLVMIGRPLTVSGILDAYFDFVKLVVTTKYRIRNFEGKIRS